MQKTDLIAELKRTKDIPGIKKLKVERAQVEKNQEQNLMSEISKAFNVTNFVDQVRNKHIKKKKHVKKKHISLFILFLFFLESMCVQPCKRNLEKMSNPFLIFYLKIFFFFLFSILLCSSVLKFRIVIFFNRFLRRTARET